MINLAKLGEALGVPTSVQRVPRLWPRTGSREETILAVEDLRQRHLALQERLLGLRREPPRYRDQAAISAQAANLTHLQGQLCRAAARASRHVRAADLTVVSFPVPGPALPHDGTPRIWAERAGSRAVGRRGRARVEDAWRLYVEGQAVMEGTRRQMVRECARACLGAAAALGRPLPRS